LKIKKIVEKAIKFTISIFAYPARFLLAGYFIATDYPVILAGGIATIITALVLCGILQMLP